MSPWPEPYKAAISFTMDNLGEAQDVLKGTWKDPIGTHYSITNQLPRMLELLNKHGIKSTYFQESWSLTVYTLVVKNMILENDVEVAWHGWQHEVWHSMDEEAEKQNFEKSFETARGYGLQYRGFRPPGGKVNERTYRLLKNNGVQYLSPLGGPEVFGILKLRVDEQSELVILPFEWHGVDAFYYMKKFSKIRDEYGEQSGVMEPADFEKVLMRKIDETVKAGGYLSILFHPFLQLSEEKFAVLESVLKRISEDNEIWCAPCGEVAEWMLENKGAFPVVGQPLSVVSP
ncbi:hypothetical protein V8F33_007294 [Rhypophila sp. PSN 637]